MPATNNRITIDEASVTQTAHEVAGSLAEAAEPGPVPAAAGASPIDGAAASIAGAIAFAVAASAADIAPRGPQGLAKTQAALAMMKAQDGDNAAEIQAVPANLAGADAHRATGVQAVGGDPWEDWEDFRDGSEPVPLQPGGAGPGPSVLPGTGIPENLI